jgi:hypothetical protein
MNTYEQERNELIDWIKQKNQEDIEAHRKDTTKGKDGDLTYEYQQVVKEYNRRLIELKQKYGRETPAREQVPQIGFVYASGK